MSRPSIFYALFFMIAVGSLMIAAALFGYHNTTNLSDVERQTEFIKQYNEIESEKQADFAKRFTTANAKAEIGGAVLGSARFVSADLAYKATLKELFEDLEVDKTINAERAESKLEPLTIDEIYANFQSEGLMAIHSSVRDAMEFFADGTVIVHLSHLSAVGISISPSLGWFLGSDYLGVSSLAYAEVCENILVNESEKYVVTFTLNANPEMEDLWKKEVLFSGTVSELCSTANSALKYYQEQGVVVFKRPDAKFLPAPSKFFELASLKDLKIGDMLYFPRITETGGVKVGIGFFEGTRKFGLKAEVIDFHSEFDSTSDIGAPVYYASGDKNHPVKLVGFILPDGTVVSAGFVLAGLDY